MQQGYIALHETVFPTLLAVSMEEQARGLMFVKPPTPVMTFVYSSPQLNAFWMKDTPSPLDIVFVCNGAIIEIAYGEPYSTKRLGGWELSDLVIELPYGTTQQEKIKLGDSVELISPDKQKLKNIVAQSFTLPVR